MTAESKRGRARLAMVLVAFAVVNLGMLWSSGVRLGGDSPLYLEGARGLLSGEPLTARQPSYLGYISIVALCQWIGVGLTGLVLLQVAVATLAAGVVYRIGAELAGPTAGWLSVALLTVDVDTNRWHAYVLADSLFASVCAVAVWLVYRAAVKPSSPQALNLYLAAAAVVLAAALIRPEGWFVMPAAAAYWVVRGATTATRRWGGLAAVAGCCLVLVAVVAPRLSGNVQAVGPGEMLRHGQTIWDYEGWRVAMPAAPPSDAGFGSAGSAVVYAVQHPLSTLTLMAARVGVHAAHVRPFYSRAHNAAIVIWLVPAYAFGAYGAWRLRNQPLVRWAVAAIAAQALVVALTHADWDGRYLAHVMPLWYPLTAGGLILAVGGRLPMGAVLRA